MNSRRAVFVSLVVLVQPEMEKQRSPLVLIPPFLWRVLPKHPSQSIRWIDWLENEPPAV